jgi:uncharacterized protein YoxC
MTNEDKIRELLIKADALESEVDLQLKGLRSSPFDKQTATLTSKQGKLIRDKEIESLDKLVSEVKELCEAYLSELLGA